MTGLFLTVSGLRLPEIKSLFGIHILTRPYQHVLEPLAVYLEIAMKQYEDGSMAGYYNVGPDDMDCVTTGTLTDLFCQAWGGGQTWINQYDGGPHEANFLKLDCSKIKRVFGWDAPLPCKRSGKKRPSNGLSCIWKARIC